MNHCCKAAVERESERRFESETDLVIRAMGFGLLVGCIVTSLIWGCFVWL